MEEPLLTKTVQQRLYSPTHKKRGCATAHHHTMPLYTTVDTLTTTHYWTEEGPNETLLFLAAAVTAHCDKTCHKSILKPFELYLSYAAEVLILYYEKCLLLVRNDKILWDPQTWVLVWFGLAQGTKNNWLSWDSYQANYSARSIEIVPRGGPPL